MARGEVAAIVGIENIVDASYDPAWILLAPNRLTQRKDASIGFASVHQFESVAMRFGAFVGEGYKVCTHAADDVDNGSAAWGLLTKIPRKPLHLPHRRI
jgi:hypothetical protein